MGWTVLYIAFGVVALWLLGEVLLQYKARLRWRLLAFCGFLCVVFGVLLPSVSVIVGGALTFAAGQTCVTLSFRRGFSTGWALGGKPGTSRRRRPASQPGEMRPLSPLSEDTGDGVPGEDTDYDGPVGGSPREMGFAPGGYSEEGGYGQDPGYHRDASEYGQDTGYRPNAGYGQAGTSGPEGESPYSAPQRTSYGQSSYPGETDYPEENQQPVPSLDRPYVAPYSSEYEAPGYPGQPLAYPQAYPGPVHGHGYPSYPAAYQPGSTPAPYSAYGGESAAALGALPGQEPSGYGPDAGETWATAGGQPYYQETPPGGVRVPQQRDATAPPTDEYDVPPPHRYAPEPGYGPDPYGNENRY